MTLTLEFQGQNLKKPYLWYGTADWHGTERMYVIHSWPWYWFRSLPASVHLLICVCVCVCQPWACCALSHHQFKLELPNWDQRCQTHWLRSLLLDDWPWIWCKNLSHFELLWCQSQILMSDLSTRVSRDHLWLNPILSEAAFEGGGGHSLPSMVGGGNHLQCICAFTIWCHIYWSRQPRVFQLLKLQILLPITLNQSNLKPQVKTKDAKHIS